MLYMRVLRQYAVILIISAPMYSAACIAFIDMFEGVNHRTQTYLQNKAAKV